MAWPREERPERGEVGQGKSRKPGGALDGGVDGQWAREIRGDGAARAPAELELEDEIW